MAKVATLASTTPDARRARPTGGPTRVTIWRVRLSGIVTQRAAMRRAGGPSVARVSDRRRQLGALGEQLACDHLGARGYEMVDRNFRTRYGEIDVVASNTRFLVFCEVKTRVLQGRPGPFGPLASVGPRKRRQLRRMAVQWLADRGRPRGGGESVRFDAIGVTLSPAGRLLLLDHVENAF